MPPDWSRRGSRRELLKANTYTTMNITNITILGLLASCFLLPTADAKGLLGQSYVGFGAGHERSEPPIGSSVDGTSIAGEYNLPLPRRYNEAAFDINFRGNLARFDETDFEVDILEVETLFRAFMPNPRGMGMKPYVGAGVGWENRDATVAGVSGDDDTFNVPAEVGVEFAGQQLSLTPFFRYSYKRDREFDDTWSAGATAAYWINRRWGIFGRAIHTDHDDDGDTLSIRAGALFAF